MIQHVSDCVWMLIVKQIKMIYFISKIFVNNLYVLLFKLNLSLYFLTLLSKYII